MQPVTVGGNAALNDLVHRCAAARIPRDDPRLMALSSVPHPQPGRVGGVRGTGRADGLWSGLLPVLVAAGVLAAAGCGGAPAPAPAPPAPVTPAGTAPPATAAAPDPNAPEVNDPGDIPDNQAFVPFVAPDGTFSVSVPEGWARSGDGSATVFTDKFNSIRIEAQARATAADVGSVRAEVVPRLQASVPGFALGEVRLVQRRGGSAVLLTYEADSPPNPVTGKSVRQSVERYAFWHGGREAVLTLSGAKGADNVDPWRLISDSVTWTR